VFIDPSKHAVVEASAGTGKTYAIQNLVLDLLCREKVTLDRILLVTFTEKATGELKARLRKAIDDQLSRLPPPADPDGHKVTNDENPSRRALLQDALDNFDRASIFTIHGFCQRLLTEYALEQHHDLRREHVSDAELVRPALRQVQRGVWRRQLGPQLPQVLALADYNAGSAREWERKILELGRIYRTDLHELRPAPRADALVLAAPEDACCAMVAQLARHAGSVPGEVESHAWYTALSAVGVHHGTRQKRLGKFVAPLLRWLGKALRDERPLQSFLRFQGSIADDFSDEGFAARGFLAFFEKISPAHQQDIAAQCAGLTEAIQELQRFHETFGAVDIANQLVVQTVEQVRAALAQFKTEHGLFSFDDLIGDVHQALAPDNPRVREFVGALRKRFDYAIVDEFQDTDAWQWRILHRLFVEGRAGGLVVVGDPKQAIFSFRGADLPTYHQAVQTMLQATGLDRYQLETNRRTVDELLQPLNRLFEAGEWFDDASKIEYRPVAAPPEDERRIKLKRATDIGAPLTIVDLRRAARPKKAQRQFADYAAGEIRRLLAAGVEFTQGQDGAKRLNAGDICVLVFKRAEAEPLAAALTAAGIPHSLYKQRGLWRSEEAEHVGIILQALAAPDDRAAFRKALLTSFFRVPPARLALCEDIPARHPARMLFQRWLVFAEKRQWSALSQSLLDETGVLFDDEAKTSLDRRFSNLRHLLGSLEEAAHRDNLDLLGLVDFYESRRQESDETQPDYQPIDTEAPKVKIMTIHASKGLEFPIVFLAGGFTKRTYEPLAIYRNAGRRVYNLDPDKAAKDAHDKEQDAEYRRLLYVALTRAMLKLYVPLVNPGHKPYEGPVSTVLAPALDRAGLVSVSPFPGAAVVEPVSLLPATMANTFPERAASKTIDGELFPAAPAQMGKRGIVMRSFSSLQRDVSRTHFGEEVPRADDEGPEQPPDPFRGPVFGDIVHLVLEKIDFAAVGTASSVAAMLEKNSPLRAVLDGPVARHAAKMRGREPLEQFQSACAERVAQLVWNALRTPLPELGCRLCDVPPDQRLCELEFLYPEDLGVVPADANHPDETFVTGFMDLVFRKDGLYYLLDWKTNDLDGYDPPAIARAMDQHGYHRQYRLYLHALARWLGRRHGAAFDFLQHFGGVYYLFLRGMSGDARSPGIFYRRPTAHDLDLDIALAEARSQP
jgi:exodeoxyribonuclease V beta subunit